MSEIATVPPPGNVGDLNLAIARPVFAYLEANHGRQALTQLAERTGIDEDVDRLRSRSRRPVCHEQQGLTAHCGRTRIK